MYLKTPYEKDIEFTTNIYEITKISLEHDYSINDNVLLGNFYITGEYKAHSISINTEEFKYTLPFELDLDKDIRSDSIEINIEEFNYEVEDNILKINIEYGIKGEINEDLFQKVDEDLNVNDYLIDDKREVNNEEDKEVNREIKEEKKEEIKDIIDNKKEDSYVTYHIHIVKDSDTLESISNNYNIPINIINEYNNIDNIDVGMKLIIPILDE